MFISPFSSSREEMLTPRLLISFAKFNRQIARPFLIAPIPCHRHFCGPVVPTPTVDENQNRCAEIPDVGSMLRQIVDYHKAKDRIYVLPWRDRRAMRSVEFLFEQMMLKGVRREFLLDACQHEEGLFQAITKTGKEVFKVLELFVECFDLTYEDAIRFYAKYSTKLVGMTANEMESRLRIFTGRGIQEGGVLREIIAKCPAVLFEGELQYMDNFWEHISNFFLDSEIKTLMSRHPHMCLLNPEDVEMKYEYIFYHMGIEGIELVESKYWMDLPLEEIMMRHKFMVKAGKYTFPDPKKPQLKRENPGVNQIFDSSDRVFATMQTGVTHEEWMVFRDMCKQEEIMAEKERPFERVKPSIRKAYERKMKAAREKEEGEID